METNYSRVIDVIGPMNRTGYVVCKLSISQLAGYCWVLMTVNWFAIPGHCLQLQCDCLATTWLMGCLHDPANFQQMYSKYTC